MSAFDWLSTFSIFLTSLLAKCTFNCTISFVCLQLVLDRKAYDRSDISTLNLTSHSLNQRAIWYISKMPYVICNKTNLQHQNQKTKFYPVKSIRYLAYCIHIINPKAQNQNEKFFILGCQRISNSLPFDFSSVSQSRPFHPAEAYPGPSEVLAFVSSRNPISETNLI